MTESPGTESPSARRRRRRRATSSQGAPIPSEQRADPPTALPAPPEPQRPAKRPRAQRDTGERGLRDLVGAGTSQLGVSGALRGRDVNRPSEDDLAEAEQHLTIVRRHWQPPTEPRTP